MPVWRTRKSVERDTLAVTGEQVKYRDSRGEKDRAR